MNFRFVVLIVFLNGCAVLHHAQIGDIDNRRGFELRPFVLKVSEMGINLQEARDIGKALAQSDVARERMDQIHSIISMFQMGPRTGNPVFNDKYAQVLRDEIYRACPSGWVTGITSIREMRKYPVISGEIVKITGFCMFPKDERRKGVTK